MCTNKNKVLFKIEVFTKSRNRELDYVDSDHLRSVNQL